MIPNFFRNSFSKIFFSFFVIFSFQEKISAQDFDYSFLKDLQNHRTTAGVDINNFITKTSPYLSFGTPIIMFGVGLLEHNSDLRDKGLQTGIAVGATIVETYVLKKIIDRPRPFVTHPDIIPYAFETDASFPSGHTSAAFSLATSLSLNYPKWYVIAPAFLWASATGYSRLYLGVHYPTDVLAGAVLGAGTSWLAYRINKKYFSKKPNPISFNPAAF